MKKLMILLAFVLSGVAVTSCSLFDEVTGDKMDRTPVLQAGPSESDDFVM